MPGTVTCIARTTCLFLRMYDSIQGVELDFLGIWGLHFAQAAGYSFAMFFWGHNEVMLLLGQPCDLLWASARLRRVYPTPRQPTPPQPPGCTVFGQVQSGPRPKIASATLKTPFTPNPLTNSPSRLVQSFHPQSQKLPWARKQTGTVVPGDFSAGVLYEGTASFAQAAWQRTRAAGAA